MNAKETTTIMAIALAVVLIAGLIAGPAFTDQEADAQKKKKKNGEKKSCKKNGGGGGTGD
jgi:cell division septation protein DedD